ncbi:hypothetical protein TIFTF001_049694 [Ficus carica]|uniref:Uncharacterized protein n=2 Tax=Ficus carica TaxID=3494 RepID=A0AA87ZGU3_FICCA|nr:hypothetical protein TIFTF001_049688 [Ficus carica]GMN31567.1 hypothetical protein TIFTF001_049694 [Ficus carica]
MSKLCLHKTTRSIKLSEVAFRNSEIEKENVKCGSKRSDVLIGVPERCRNRKSITSAEENLVLDGQLVHPLATPARELIFRQNYTQTRLYG